MKNLIFAIIALTATTSSADWYVQGSLGIADNSTDQFQIPLDTPLGRLSIGYEFDNDIIIEFDHISSIPNKRDYRGINAVWVTKRLYF